MSATAAGPVLVTADHLAVTFDPAAAAAAESDPGTVVSFDTSDAVIAQIAAGEPLEEIGLEQANAITGPLAAYVCARVGLRSAGPSGSMIDGLEAVLAVAPDPR